MKTSKMQIRTGEEFNKYIIRTSTLPTGIDGPTPFILVDDIISNRVKVDWSNPNLKILDPAFGFGTFLFVCYLKLIEFHSEEHILNNMLYGIEIEPFRYELTKTKFAIKNLYLGDFLDPNDEIKRMLNMVKFDVIVGNPPYQRKRGNSDATIAIWDRFVLKSFQHLSEGGLLGMVHPSGWRNASGRFTDVRDLLLSRQMEYLEIHNESDGLRVFGAKTRYDWYILKNTENNNNSTVIKFEDKSLLKVNLSGLPFIPNHSYNQIKNLIADSDQERVEILHSYSAYFCRGKKHRSINHVVEEKTSTHKYPVVYTVNINGGLTLKYSSINSNGHFGIPKVILMPATGTGKYIDIKGEYGLTQFVFAIVDEPANLPLIKRALESKKFENLMTACSVGLNGYNHKVLSTFRKDFWKEFV
jgi:hypothetical protein